jgi:hypothetical protein
MNKRIASTVAASLMILGGGVLAAPSASAYPAGEDPSVGIVGSNTFTPRHKVVLRAFHFRPGCTLEMSVKDTSIEDTDTVLPNGTRTFSFRAPSKAGSYTVTVHQKKGHGCGSPSASTRIRVR